MRKPFKVTEKCTQLSLEIRRGIEAGEWSGNLPSLRRLMRDYGVTRTVATHALEQLICDGDILPPSGRRPPKISRKRRSGETTGTLIVHADPVEMRTGDHRQILLALEASLPGPVVPLSIPAAGHTPQAVVARTMESPIQHVVVMDHDAAVADLLVRSGRTVVAAGAGGATSLAPQVAVSHEALVRGALRKAFAYGHRRVSFPLWRRLSEVAALMRRWISDEYLLHGYKYSPDFDAPLIEPREPAALHETLRALLRHTPPTALVVSDFRQWIAAVSILGECGLRTPGDVSLICLCSTDEWETATPYPAHFRFPVADFGAAVAKALTVAGRGCQRTDIFLLPEWTPGESLAPPRDLKRPGAIPEPEALPKASSHATPPVPRPKRPSP